MSAQHRVARAQGCYYFHHGPCKYCTTLLHVRVRTHMHTRTPLERIIIS